MYTQFQKDPAHKYYTFGENVARRVYNIKSHSYYLGRTDYVGDLLNDLDEIECDVEEGAGKVRRKGKGEGVEGGKGREGGEGRSKKKNKKEKKDNNRNKKIREKSWEGK